MSDFRPHFPRCFVELRFEGTVKLTRMSFVRRRLGPLRIPRYVVRSFSFGGNCSLVVYSSVLYNISDERIPSIVIRIVNFCPAFFALDHAGY